MRDTRPSHTDEFKAAIKAIRATITPQLYHKLITLIPRPIDKDIYLIVYYEIWIFFSYVLYAIKVTVNQVKVKVKTN